jgi:crossover junction endodeoxyribonuclease RuvC
MFDSCVLGVDPGMAATGLAVVERDGARTSLRWSGTVRTPAELDEELRLRAIAEHVRTAIGAHSPGAVAIERVAWGRNVTSGLRVARATGAIMLVAADAGVPVEEYGPLEVKMAITGVGNAPKGQVRAALARAHGLGSVPSQPDAADAVAVAVCHLTQARLRGAARRAGAR